VVGLLVVPLQLALVPLLNLHNQIGIGQSFLGIWLAHTGFGLPLAIYLLRNYMVGLPRDIIESAKVDGATDFQVFVKIVLPLSFPALASFAIFQFLWTWNDLLVAKVFLPLGADSQVMTVKIADDLLGSRGGTGAFWRRRPSSRSRCRFWCSSRCSATSCAAFWPDRSSNQRTTRAMT
jgi:alpha-glucoside transport system permease protein